MAASYPAGTYSPRTKKNKSGVVYDANKKTIGYAEDITKLDDEVVAIETELGTNPKGDKATVKARLEAIEAGLIDPSKEYIDIFNWCGTEGITETHIDGSYTMKRQLILLQSGATRFNYTHIRFTDDFPTNFFESGKPFTIEIIILNINSVTGAAFELGVGDIPSGSAEHFGFIISDDGIIYAVNAQGSYRTITSTGVTASTGVQFTRLKAVFTPGTDIKYYINDVLKITHTSMLPYMFGGLYIGMRVNTGADADKTIELGRILIKKEY